MSWYAISDIHGHLDELKTALSRVDLSVDARLILLGDYIDGGPDSGGVLRFLRDLQQRYGAEQIIVLRGNHEDDFLDWLDTYGGANAGEPDASGSLPWNGWLDRDEDFGTLRTLVTPEQWAFFQTVLPVLSEDARNIEAARMVLDADPALIAWLRKLPYFYEAEKQIFVHAGVDEEAGDWWSQVTPARMFTGKFPAETGWFFKDIIAGHVGTSRLAGDGAYHGVFQDGESHYYIDGSIQRGGRLNVLAWSEEQGYTAPDSAIRTGCKGET